MNYLETLSAIHPDIIHNFLHEGATDGIPKDLHDFIWELQYAMEIYEHEKNITRAASDLRLRIIAEHKRSVPLRTCKARIYAAINYFHIDNNVTVKVWENDFADKYHDLAKMAIATGDLRTAKQCYDAARDARTSASEATARESDWAPIFLMSPEMTAEQAGFETKSLKEIAAKNNQGYYLDLINNLKVDDDERKRILRDANVQDIDYEELNPSEDD